MPINNQEEEVLYQVGPGTPSGEVFRRYWLPVETSANLGGGRGAFAGSNNPLRLKILGEHLVLYRDASGKPGLLAEHCSHRGTSLYYGRVEDEGLRCLYHGWLYNRDGSCLETPGEPPDSMFKHTVKHPSYPCVEVGGLIFAYLGPVEKQPPFPRYPQLFREDGVRITGKGNRLQNSSAFLQILDNVLDVWHREICHGWYRGNPMVGSIHHGANGQPATPLKYERTPWGACYASLQNTREPGVYEYHETHAVLPCQRLGQPGASSINWAVPLDDYTTRWFGVSFVAYDKDGKLPAGMAQRMAQNTPTDSGGPFYDGWFEDVGHWWNFGHPLRQGPIWEDEAVMSTQGPEERNRIPDFDRWRLTSSDRGVVLMHDLWREQIERVQQGLDPVGIFRDLPEGELIPVPGEVRHLSWEEGMALFNMSVEERTDRYMERLYGRATASPRS